MLCFVGLDMLPIFYRFSTKLYQNFVYRILKTLAYFGEIKDLNVAIFLPNGMPTAVSPARNTAHPACRFERRVGRLPRLELP